MEENNLSKLSAEQIAALTEDQKAIFCALSPSDQDFFCADLFGEGFAGVLGTARGEIMKRKPGGVRNVKSRSRASLAQVASSESHDKAEGRAGCGGGRRWGLGAAADDGGFG